MDIRAMGEGEWRLRFFLTLHHIVPTKAVGYDFYDINQATSITMRGTIKLTFFYYTDKLMHSSEYHPYHLNDLLSFNRYYLHLQQARQLIPEPDHSEVFS